MAGNRDLRREVLENGAMDGGPDSVVSAIRDPGTMSRGGHKRRQNRVVASPAFALGRAGRRRK